MRAKARAGLVCIAAHHPSLAGKEIDYIREAIERGQLAGDGSFTERCQRRLAAMVGARAVLLTHSCTAALEMGPKRHGPAYSDERCTIALDQLTPSHRKLPFLVPVFTPELRRI